MIKTVISNKQLKLEHDHFCIEHMADEVQLLIELMIKDEYINEKSLSDAKSSSIIKANRDKLLDIIKSKQVHELVLTDKGSHLSEEEL